MNVRAEVEQAVRNALGRLTRQLAHSHGVPDSILEQIGVEVAQDQIIVSLPGSTRKTRPKPKSKAAAQTPAAAHTDDDGDSGAE